MDSKVASSVSQSYWLLKSEPEVYSIDHLAKEKTLSTDWTGVRNYQARNYMRDSMKKGDLCLFYHSNAEPPGAVGIVEVSKESHPDPSQFDKKSEYFDPKATKDKPIWFLVSVKFKARFSKMVSLNQIRETKGLENMVLLQKGSRLSVQPVTSKEFELISKLGGITQ